ncbi:MAG: hypothetical protein WD226_13695 [Planctomycetota bacterium]
MTLRGLAGWIPVLVAGCVVAQLWSRGWKPAVAESRRLDAAEAEVRARHEALLETRAILADDEARIGDPIWQERVRRSLSSAGEPLRLESLSGQRHDQQRDEQREDPGRTLGGD